MSLCRRPACGGRHGETSHKLTKLGGKLLSNKGGPSFLFLIPTWPLFWWWSRRHCSLLLFTLFPQIIINNHATHDATSHHPWIHIISEAGARLCLQICGRGWFWEARKICCSCCHHIDNTGGNVHITISIQQIDPCWYILIIIWISVGENLSYFYRKNSKLYKL